MDRANNTRLEKVRNSVTARGNKVFAQKKLEKLTKLFQTLAEKHKITEKELFELVKRKRLLSQIPVSIFANNLSPLEALVQYCKDMLNLNFKAIASELNRDERTIWTTYTNAKKKNIKLMLDSEIRISISLFSDRRISILESLVKFLHEEHKLSFAEIARLLGKDPRTIWTAYDRCKKKYIATQKK